MPLSEITYRRRVQFPETDMSGIVHFTTFFKYVEEAEHALWRASGISIVQPEREIGWPRVAASFEFRRPLRFEDEVDICLRIVAKTRKTLRYSAEIRKGDEVMALGTLTTICVRRRGSEPIRAIDIPDDIARLFEVSAAGEFKSR